VSAGSAIGGDAANICADPHCDRKASGNNKNAISRARVFINTNDLSLRSIFSPAKTRRRADF